MKSKKQIHTEKIRAERKAKQKRERFERTEGQVVFVYNSFHAHHYIVFSAEARDKGQDHSFAAYYQTLDKKQRCFIEVRPLLPGLAEIRLRLKNEEFKTRSNNIRR